MLSFPLLFLTLLTGYGQVVDPGVHAPAHRAPVAARVGDRGVRVGVAARHRRAVRPAPAAAAARGRTRGGRGSSARTRAQAFFVEATVAVVVLAVIAAARARVRDWATQPAWHFPLTAWLGGSWRGVETEHARDRDRRRRDRQDRRLDVVVRGRRAAADDGRRVAPVPRRSSTSTRAASPTAGPRSAPCSRSPPSTDPVDLEGLEDLPDDARLGVGAIEDFTWKGLLDFSTCTECGRCQDQCPAWATDKPLSPKLVTLALRDHAAATAPYLRAADESHAGLDLIGTRRHRRRRAVGLHHVRRLRAAVPGRHRARGRHRRHAPLPGAHGVGVPQGARRRVHQARAAGQPVGAARPRAARLGQGPATSTCPSSARTWSPPPTSTTCSGSAARARTRTAPSARRGPSPSCCTPPA